MEVVHWNDCEDKQIDKFPYKGNKLDVIGTSIRWLSQHGDDGNGIPDYGLRFFTIQPGGQIPIHNHFYHQTMYILSGQFECYQYDPQSDEVVKKVVNEMTLDQKIAFTQEFINLFRKSHISRLIDINKRKSRLFVNYFRMSATARAAFYKPIRKLLINRYIRYAILNTYRGIRKK